MEGCGGGLTWGTIPAFAWKNPQGRDRNRYLRNTKQNSAVLYWTTAAQWASIGVLSSPFPSDRWDGKAAAAGRRHEGTRGSEGIPPLMLNLDIPRHLVGSVVSCTPPTPLVARPYSRCGSIVLNSATRTKFQQLRVPLQELYEVQSASCYVGT